MDTDIGATDELSLRVSVAALVRVLFEHPQNGAGMLALERTATLRAAEGGCCVEVKAQPFGGAIRLHDPGRLRDAIGDFHFDSGPSRSEQDFRIFVRPSAWEAVREFCLRHFNQPDDSVLESDPTRELAEEFAGALGVDLQPEQFVVKPAGTVLENTPSLTGNVYARGYLTVRLYRIFEVQIVDRALSNLMLANSENLSNEALEKFASQGFQAGGPGWANAILTSPFKLVHAAYSATPVEMRNDPIPFHDHRLDETVAAVLDTIAVPKYQRL